MLINLVHSIVVHSKAINTCLERPYGFLTWLTKNLAFIIRFFRPLSPGILLFVLLLLAILLPEGMWPAYAGEGTLNLVGDRIASSRTSPKGRSELPGSPVVAPQLPGQEKVYFFNADSLQKSPSGYYLYPLSWRFHAGDDLRWADPLWDDNSWYFTRTGSSVGATPPGWQGIGWFRLRFRVDSSLVGRLLAFRIGHMGASQIYLDGKQIGGFGRIGHSLASEQTYLPDRESVAFQLEQAGEHVLAVRLSVFHRYLTRKVRYGQGFVSWLASHDQMDRYVNGLGQSNVLSLVPAIGAGLFALLHLFLFLFYPTKVSNVYYSCCLTFFSAAALLVYLDNQTTDPAFQQTLFYILRGINLAYVIASVAFVYSVCYGRLPGRIRFFYVVGAVQFGLFLLFPAGPFREVWLLFLGIGTLEILRVVLLGMKRKQPGVWLIGLGMLATAGMFFLSAGNMIFLLPGNPSGQNLLLSLGFLLLPFASSLYLAQEFALTSRNLEVQLQQVKVLSAQTLAQKAEKLQLLAVQKEQLEQTVRKRTGQLEQQADQLLQVNQTKTRFFTNLAHEFRTPLTLMLGPVEQILSTSQDSSIRQQADLVQRNAQRLLRLVNQLLELSKLEAGKTSLALNTEDLIMLVKGTLFSFKSLAEQKQITLQVNADLSQLTMALDRDKLEKIFSNLFSNAIKFTPPGGIISVTITAETITDTVSEQEGSKPWVQIVIQDTGKGIPAQKLAFVFNQFYQADDSHTREQEGFGIGLALTKELVELHGGRIAINSIENQGTLVTVSLPYYQQDTLQQQRGQATHAQITASEQAETVLLPIPPAARLHVSQPIQSSNAITSVITQTPKVGELIIENELLSTDGQLTNALPTVELLIIEDNSEVRQFIRSSLEHQYRIREAAGGSEGIELACQYVPDLILTDLMMPHMDGYQVCHQVKHDPRTSHIPVLMLTAKADLDSRIEGLQTGADSYLVKPFHQRELLAQIANLILTRQQLRKRYRRENVWQGNQRELPSQEQVFLNQIRSLIEVHLADEHFGVEQLSEQMALSRTQLHRKLKALIDYSPGELIRLIRLEHALALLTHNVASVSEVAYRVGFANPASFSASFSRYFGFAPNEVKKKSDHPAY